MTPSIINTESCLVLSPNENGVGLSGQVQQEREDKPESWQALFVCVLRAELALIIITSALFASTR